MSSNINSSTDFTNVTISNDYPCLTGGSWTAKVVNGVTVYTDGTTTYTGPVNLIDGNLTIESGAIVDGLTAFNTATINIANGGVLENSDIFNSTVTVDSGGLSEGNNYVSTGVTLDSSSTSSNDSFYHPNATTTTSGTLTTGSQTISFQTSTGPRLLYSAGTSGVSIDNPHYYKSGSTTGTYDTVSLGKGSYFGDPKVAVGHDASVFNIVSGSMSSYVLSNNYPTYIGGTWTASVNSDGVTVYTGTGVTGGVATGTVTVTGPINLISIGAFNITAGAVVDGVTVTGVTSPVVTNYGTIQNSFMANTYIDNYGLTQNNTFISEIYYNFSGGVSKSDYLYEPGLATYGTYNLTNTDNATLPDLYLADGAGNIYLYDGSSFDGSYAEEGGSAAPLYIYPYYASSVSCFLAGSMINTANGLIAIEDIKVGDVVISYHGNQQENRAVIWTGYNTVVVNQSLPEDEANYPVRVLKNAIADNIPCKDLLVTQEHCILIDNQFIPVRMLVNHSTIFYDHNITEYTYYHIETELHSVIMADGVLTESYLDTGNRASFRYNGNIVSIVNKNKQWNIDSAAPLVTTRNIVELIFYKLLTRAHMLGLTYNLPNLPKTTDYGLYLLTDNNEKIEISYQNQNRFVFKIPENITNVRLMSHTSQPSKTIGVFVDDRRHLGVLVGDITLLERNEIHSIDTHLSDPNLSGWDIQESPSFRWTNGNALLSLRQEESQHTAMLILHIINGGPYFVVTEEKTSRNSLELVAN